MGKREKMKTIFIGFLLSLTVITHPAIAGIVAAVTSSKLDSLTRDNATIDPSSKTVVAAPVVRKSAVKKSPPSSPQPAVTPINTPVSAPTPIATNPAPTPPTETTRPRLYVGTQLGDSIVGGLIGLQLTKLYAVEARYDYVDTIYLPNGNTKSSTIGVAGIALFPLKLSNLEPFNLYAKVGYERNTLQTTITDAGIPPFPATTTITTTVRGRVLLGGGGQYDFSNKMSGRVGMNFIGSDHSIYIAALYKF